MCLLLWNKIELVFIRVRRVLPGWLSMCRSGCMQWVMGMLHGSDDWHVYCLFFFLFVSHFSFILLFPFFLLNHRVCCVSKEHVRCGWLNKGKMRASTRVVPTKWEWIHKLYDERRNNWRSCEAWCVSLMSPSLEKIVSATMMATASSSGIIVFMCQRRRQRRWGRRGNESWTSEKYPHTANVS